MSGSADKSAKYQGQYIPKQQQKQPYKRRTKFKRRQQTGLKIPIEP